MDSLLNLFVSVDDFWQEFRVIWQNYMLTSGQRQRIRASRLSESELMTLVILFHQSHYRNFKAFYLCHVRLHLKNEFPNLVSYQRMVALMERVGIPLLVYLHLCMGRCTGISFIDSTPLRVCHNRRSSRHRVFEGWAARGKSSMGWFFGFKLHIVINHLGELLAVNLTAGNIDDRDPVPTLLQRLFGKVFGDKGYLSATLRDDLREKGIELITSIRRNMTPQLLPLKDKLLLKRRALIETVNDQLKNMAHIDHSRHRCPNNFFVNLGAGLIAYCHQDKKPTLQLDPNDYQALAMTV